MKKILKNILTLFTALLLAVTLLPFHPVEVQAGGGLSFLEAHGIGGDRKISLEWIKSKKADGYEVYWSYCDGADRYRFLADTKDNTVSHRNLNNHKNYKYYVKSYKWVRGEKDYLSQSQVIHVSMTGQSTTNVKKLSISKTKITLSLNKTYQISCRISKEDPHKKYLKHAKKYRYLSSDNAVATVDSKGVVTAKKKGKCTVYVVTNNGKTAKLKVKVK